MTDLCFQSSREKECGGKDERQVVYVHLALCARRGDEGEQLEEVLSYDAVGGRQKQHQQLQALFGGSSR